MTQLVAVLNSASKLSAILFAHANEPTFAPRERQAFRSDGFLIVSTTQALATSPAHGLESQAYEPVEHEVDEAAAATEAAAPGNATSIHLARLEVVQAAEAMKAVTAKPGISVL